jgi:hypothetical protein
VVKGDRQISASFPLSEVIAGIPSALLDAGPVGSNPTFPTKQRRPWLAEHGAGQVAALKAVRSSQRHAVLSQARTPLRATAVVGCCGRCSYRRGAGWRSFVTMLHQSAAQPRSYDITPARSRARGRRWPHSLADDRYVRGVAQTLASTPFPQPEVLVGVPSVERRAQPEGRRFKPCLLSPNKADRIPWGSSSIGRAAGFCAFPFCEV